RKMGLLDNWGKVIQLIQALQTRFKTHEERRPIMEAAGIQMRTYLKGAARPLGIRVLTRFVNGGDVCTEEPSAEALLFYLLVAHALVTRPAIFTGE
ncbi:MAG: hypothetical protein KDB07_05795, partial [Planctomycetes bacterium]|nr:hypothetical protein [Planctomycetota bacterium]